MPLLLIFSQVALTNNQNQLGQLTYYIGAVPAVSTPPAPTTIATQQYAVCR